MKYYRGSPDCKFKQFSYFTKDCKEAEIYASEFYKGDLCEVEIEPKKPLKAWDIWDAGKKLGVEEMKDPRKQREKILRQAVKKGYDSIMVGPLWKTDEWLIVLNPNIVKSVKKIDKCPSRTVG